eukprot:TRINITY_DN4944_c0_g1_i1.p1 TRINITY_DN4944_c0_g1~~TRINITY_DN4944_c0_g1_i1.p1  ORF type:complete len:1582 (+),score=374.02 TRINITY_DN4944_c0_g1_i1:79-4824(+)
MAGAQAVYSGTHSVAFNAFLDSCRRRLQQQRAPGADQLITALKGTRRVSDSAGGIAVDWRKMYLAKPLGAILAGLAEHPELPIAEVDLSANSIGDKHAAALADAIRSRKALQRVLLSPHALTPEGAATVRAAATERWGAGAAAEMIDPPQAPAAAVVQPPPPAAKPIAAGAPASPAGRGAGRGLAPPSGAATPPAARGAAGTPISAGRGAESPQPRAPGGGLLSALSRRRESPSPGGDATEGYTLSMTPAHPGGAGAPRPPPPQQSPPLIAGDAARRPPQSPPRQPGAAAARVTSPTARPRPSAPGRSAALARVRWTAESALLRRYYAALLRGGHATGRGAASPPRMNAIVGQRAKAFGVADPGLLRPVRDGLRAELQLQGAFPAHGASASPPPAATSPAWQRRMALERQFAAAQAGGEDPLLSTSTAFDSPQQAARAALDRSRGPPMPPVSARSAVWEGGRVGGALRTGGPASPDVQHPRSSETRPFSAHALISRRSPLALPSPSRGTQALSDRPHQLQPPRAATPSEDAEDGYDVLAGADAATHSGLLRLPRARIESLMFKDLSRVTVLDLRGNELRSLDNLPPSLVRMDVSSNELASLDGVGNCPMLEVLNARRNRITRIGGALEHTLRLRHLLLGRNRVRRVEGVAHLTHLEVLDLAHNQLATPAAIRPLSVNARLASLTIAGNPIAHPAGRRRICLSNLPPGCGEDAVTELVRGFGSIERVALVTDRGQRRDGRAAAFVTFASAEDCAAKAAAGLHGKRMGDDPVPQSCVVRLTRRRSVLLSQVPAAVGDVPAARAAVAKHLSQFGVVAKVELTPLRWEWCAGDGQWMPVPGPEGRMLTSAAQRRPQPGGAPPPPLQRVPIGEWTVDLTASTATDATGATFQVRQHREAVAVFADGAESAERARAALNGKCWLGDSVPLIVRQMPDVHPLLTNLCPHLLWLDGKYIARPAAVGSASAFSSIADASLSQVGSAADTSAAISESALDHSAQAGSTLAGGASVNGTLPPQQAGCGLLMPHSAAASRAALGDRGAYSLPGQARRQRGRIDRSRERSEREQQRQQQLSMRMQGGPADAGRSRSLSAASSRLSSIPSAPRRRSKSADGAALALPAPAPDQCQQEPAPIVPPGQLLSSHSMVPSEWDVARGLGGARTAAPAAAGAPAEQRPAPRRRRPSASAEGGAAPAAAPPAGRVLGRLRATPQSVAPKQRQGQQRQRRSRSAGAETSTSDAGMDTSAELRSALRSLSAATAAADRSAAEAGRTSRVSFRSPPQPDHGPRHHAPRHASERGDPLALSDLSCGCAAPPQAASAALPPFPPPPAPRGDADSFVDAGAAATPSRRLAPTQQRTPQAQRHAAGGTPSSSARRGQQASPLVSQGLQQLYDQLQHMHSQLASRRASAPPPAAEQPPPRLGPDTAPPPEASPRGRPPPAAAPSHGRAAPPAEGDEAEATEWLRSAGDDLVATHLALKALLVLMQGGNVAELKRYQSIVESCGMLGDTEIPQAVVSFCGLTEELLSAPEITGAGRGARVLKMLRQLSETKTCIKYIFALIDRGEPRLLDEYLARVRRSVLLHDAEHMIP